MSMPVTERTYGTQEIEANWLETTSGAAPWKTCLEAVAFAPWDGPVTMVTRCCFTPSRALRVVAASAIVGTAQTMPVRTATAKAVLVTRMKPPLNPNTQTPSRTGFRLRHQGGSKASRVGTIGLRVSEGNLP
jgi:hypothetical protein